MSFSDFEFRVKSFAEGVSLESEPLVIITVGVLASSFIFLVLYLGQHRRHKNLEVQIERLTGIATRAREILTTTPDGLFLWDHILGGIACSSRLAELLSLNDGTNARFDDIRNCFEGDSLKNLERSVSSLRGNGTPFSILLTSGKKTLEAIGTRAQTKAGQPVADIVWVRDVTKFTNGNPSGNHAVPYFSPMQNSSGLDDRHLTTLLDAMPIPIWLRDSNLQIAFTNRAAENIVNPDPRMADTARSQGKACTERLMLDIHGNQRLVDVTEIPLGVSSSDLSTGQKLGGSVGYAIDYVEHTEMEALKKESLTQNVALQILDTAIAIFDENRQLNFFNTAYSKLFNIDPNWLAKKPLFLEVLDRQRETRTLPEASDFRAFKTNMETYFDTISTPQSDLMHLPDGRTLKQTISPHPTRGLVFTFNDVSQQLDLERSMKEASAVQRETLDNLQEGLAVFGSDGRLKLFNPVYVQIWDLNIEELGEEPHISEIIDQTRQMTLPPQKQKDWDNDSWHRHRESMIMQMLSRTATSGQMHLANGSAINHSNIPLPDGAMLLTFTDVTDSARVEAALRERAEALQEADRLKTEFIAKVSYEMRTPLNTVIGFADMLSQNLFGELNTRQSEYAKGILTTSQSLVSILSDILDLASIEAGRMELERDALDTHALLVASLTLIRERVLKKQQKLHFDCPTDIGWIIADEKRLKQVLFNLLSNAVSFTPPHGEIQLKAKRVEADVEFSVSDSGIGIPSNERERLFRPFEQGAENPVHDDATGSTSGKGLGLSLVRKFIELHAGTVELKSQPGRGTTVTCRIPTGSLDEFNKVTSQMTSGAPLDNQFQTSETKNAPTLADGKDQNLEPPPKPMLNSKNSQEFDPVSPPGPSISRQQDPAQIVTENQMPLIEDDTEGQSA